MNHSIDKELEQLERELREPLRQAVLPPPPPSETAALIAALQPEFDELKAEASAPELDFNPQVEAPSLRRLLWSQFRLNRKSLILAGSAVFLMLILLVDPERPYRMVLLGEAIPSGLFPVITPIMLIAAMLFSYRSWDRGMRAVESITPYPPALVIYCRMLMVIGLVVCWALVSTVIVGIRVAAAGAVSLPLIPFLLQWLGISMITSGAAMYVLFRKGMSLACVTASVVYALWFFFENRSIAHGLALGTRTLADFLMLVAGAFLLLRSYYRSRSLQSGDGIGGGTAR
ncbi:hypothetical protein V3851_16955 [Paenibacillus sp. M1]|uniref:Uncharacterized protein n=1 Tax=Paenibacillus haidiansis TaxID=1574488 RepID=A0ABU7VW69_9BACL